MTEGIFIANLAATVLMTGLIWHVQIVQYPLFARVGTEAFREYHDGHMRRIGFVVAPLMGVELVTAGLLMAVRPPFMGLGAASLGLGLVVVIWVSTVVLQIPQHRRLESGFDFEVHRGLVGGNAIRTAAWSLRSGVLLAVLFRGLSRGGGA